MSQFRWLNVLKSEVCTFHVFSSFQTYLDASCSTSNKLVSDRVEHHTQHRVHVGGDGEHFVQV
jgi:hypothetical protein